MSGNECRCSGSKGGSTKCPENHLAICVRGRDGECRGQCVPIPNQYTDNSESFSHWLHGKLEDTALNHLTEWRNFTGDYLDQTAREEIIGNNRGSGEIIYSNPIYGMVRVSYSYTFLDRRNYR